MKSDFSEILSGLRRGKGLSQRRVAADLGISQALLSHYENGAREPKLEFVVKACDYYKVTADYILGRNKERRNELARMKNSVRDILEELEKLKSTETAIIDKIKQMTEE